MPSPSLASSVAGEVHAFVATARHVFHSQRWDAVAPHVYRAWVASEVAARVRWEDVRDLVEGLWEDPGTQARTPGG